MNTHRFEFLNRPDPAWSSSTAAWVPRRWTWVLTDDSGRRRAAAADDFPTREDAEADTPVFSADGPLGGMDEAEAREVAKNGGRKISTRSVGEWKKQHRAIAADGTLDNRRVICIALAAHDA